MINKKNNDNIIVFPLPTDESNQTELSSSSPRVSHKQINTCTSHALRILNLISSEVFISVCENTQTGGVYFTALWKYIIEHIIKNDNILIDYKIGSIPTIFDFIPVDAAIIIYLFPNNPEQKISHISVLGCIKIDGTPTPIIKDLYCEERTIRTGGQSV